MYFARLGAAASQNESIAISERHSLLSEQGWGGFSTLAAVSVVRRRGTKARARVNTSPLSRPNGPLNCHQRGAKAGAAAAAAGGHTRPKGASFSVL